VNIDPSADSQDFDPRLRALFRLAEPVATADDGFTRQLVQRLQRRRQWRLIGRTAAAAVIVTALGVGLGVSHALPWLERTVPLLPLSAARATAPLGDWLVTPTGWVVSLLLGAWVLWRSKALRR
jgi:hypothetical protein